MAQSFTLDPEKAAWLSAESERTGESSSQIMDRALGLLMEQSVGLGKKAKGKSRMDTARKALDSTGTPQGFGALRAVPKPTRK